MSIKTLQGLLKEAMTALKSLAILTPFSNASRSRLEQAVAPHAARIASIRQSIVRDVCYRECLSRDMLVSDNVKYSTRSKPEVPQYAEPKHVMHRGASHDGSEGLKVSYGHLKRSLTSSEASLGST